MTELSIPKEVVKELENNPVLVYCATCDIILYKHEEENIVSNHVANETLLGHAGDLHHRVVRLQKEGKSV